MAGTGEEFGPCPHCGELHTEDVLICPGQDKVLPLDGRILDGKFRFTKQLGEGGMGTVWMAENILVKKTVAIKLMHVQFSRDEGVLARFRNEATAAGRIGSRYICDILDLGKSTLGPYIVMEMLKGSDMADFVQQHHPIDPGTVVLVVRQALLGLQAAHEAGIVHRDLKPENIFLHQPEPGQLLAKLMDFGISKFTEGSEAGKTGMGVLMGTPEYMSPEQTEGAAQADARTDIWAMGVIMYWALAGRNPFLGQTMAATLMNVTLREPPGLAQAAPHVAADLVAIVNHCIAKDPDARYQSAQQLHDALAPFEDHTGAMFVPYASKTSAPAMTGPPPAALTTSRRPETVSPPGISSPTPAGQPTFSNEISVAPATAGPTLGEVELGFAHDHDGRPDTNIGGGGGKWLLVLLALAFLGGGGWLAYHFINGDASSGTTEGAQVAAADTADPDEADVGGEPAADEGGEKKADVGAAATKTDVGDSGADAADAGEPVAGDEGGTPAAGSGADSGTPAGDSGAPPKSDPPKSDPPKSDPPKSDPPKSDPPKSDPPKSDPPKSDPPKSDPPKSDPPKSDPPKSDPPKSKGVIASKVVDRGRFYVAKGKVKKNVSASEAKSFCGSLGKQKYANVSRWALPAKPVRKGKWWGAGGVFFKDGKKVKTLSKQANAYCVTPKKK